MAAKRLLKPIFQPAITRIEASNQRGRGHARRGGHSVRGRGGLQESSTRRAAPTPRSRKKIGGKGRGGFVKPAIPRSRKLVGAVVADRPPWLCSPVVIRDRMETIFFKERFTTDSDMNNDGKTAHSRIKYAHDFDKTSAQQRPIRGEVNRMITPGIGSLELLQDSASHWLKGDVEMTGDFTRNLKISIADEKDAVLRVWRINVKGTLEDIPKERLGIFPSNDSKFSCVSSILLQTRN